MIPRKFYNNIIGEYYTYNTNDIFEAIYVAKHPNRIKNIDDLQENESAKIQMEKYKIKLGKRAIEVIDNNLKKKLQNINVQIYDGSELNNKFVTIKYKNGEWNPIIKNHKLILDNSSKI